ncbi:MAG: hypothetical protein GY947_21720 [Rhodobacteraceae bacterium]|nr:hypothetical protein [Paracoccaceae bacterium]
MTAAKRGCPMSASKYSAITRAVCVTAIALGFFLPPTTQIVNAGGNIEVDETPFEPSKTLKELKVQIRDCDREVQKQLGNVAYTRERVETGERNVEGWASDQKEAKAREKFLKSQVAKLKTQLRRGKDHAGEPLTANGRKEMEKDLGDQEYKLKDIQEVIRVNKDLHAEEKVHLKARKKEAAAARKKRQAAERACNRLKAELKKRTN